MKFNESQKQAISHFTGPCLTLAGPGSGKTLVITHRTRYLIEEKGIDPASILVVTFTKAAAAEMKDRFQTIIAGKPSSPSLGGKQGKPPSPSFGGKGEKGLVTFGTFHAVFFTVLRHAYHYRAENIVREEQKFIIIKNLIRKFHLEYDDENEYIGQLLTEISLVKNERMDLVHYYSTNCAHDVFRQIFAGYQEILQKNRWIDFDDMLVYTYELFTERPDILAMWQKKYSYILVDECQDINKIQYAIVRMMAKPKNNLFLVGDDDQSIYRFRGATPGLLQSFVRDYPQTKQIFLDVNYRCRPDIVEKSMNLITNNKQRFEKKVTAIGSREQAVFVKECKDQREENLAIIAAIQTYLKSGGSCGNLAILYRTNTQPRFLMEQLLEYNIPFKAKDRVPNIYDHWIARDIFAYLEISLGSRERSNFLQIMNRPKRYIGRDSLEEKTIVFEAWADYYAKNEQEWIAKRIDRLAYDCGMLSHMAPYAAINYIRKGIGYDEYLKEYAGERQIRIEELTDILDELQTSAKAYETYKKWREHIAEYVQEMNRQMHAEESNRVTLTTFHSAKGLEYEEVHILEVNEKIMPYKKAVLEEDIEEERRMFYVGMTRAQKKLYLYTVMEMNNHSMEKSRFLSEIKA